VASVWLYNAFSVICVCAALTQGWHVASPRSAYRQPWAVLHNTFGVQDRQNARRLSQPLPVMLF